jgi:hypothetical protein
MWWPRGGIIAIGRALVQARFNNKQLHPAIGLCEDICYNLRRALGSLHPATLKLYTLLSTLYTSANFHREAMGVHEEILRLELYGDDDGVDIAPGLNQAETHKQQEATVKEHLELLMRAHQRNRGWDKREETYKDLYAQLAEEFGQQNLGVPPIEKWPSRDADSKGTYTAPTAWEITGKDLQIEDINEQRNLERVSHLWAVPLFRVDSGSQANGRAI